jgi:hypothetical protein
MPCKKIFGNIIFQKLQIKLNGGKLDLDLYHGHFCGYGINSKI